MIKLRKNSENKTGTVRGFEQMHASPASVWMKIVLTCIFVMLISAGISAYLIWRVQDENYFLPKKKNGTINSIKMINVERLNKAADVIRSRDTAQ